MARRRRFLTLLLSLVSLCLMSCSGKQDDTTLTDTLKAQLFNDSALKRESIEIVATNGVVTLSGEISSEELRQQAVSLMEATPGVLAVHDSMRLASAARTPATTTPTSTASTTSAVPPRPAMPPKSTPRPTNATTAAVSQPTPAPPPPQPRRQVVPAGTTIEVLTTDPIDSGKGSKVGSVFLASLYSPVTVGDDVVIPKGADVNIRLTDAATSGTFRGTSELHLALDSVEVRGKSYPLESSTYDESGKSQGKETVKRTGIGAAVGATIGAIAGGGKGAAIGAGIGSGAGVASQVFMHGKEVRIPSETRLVFTLEKPVEITLPPAGSRTQ